MNMNGVCSIAMFNCHVQLEEARRCYEYSLTGCLWKDFINDLSFVGASCVLHYSMVLLRLESWPQENALALSRCFPRNGSKEECIDAACIQHSECKK